MENDYSSYKEISHDINTELFYSNPLNISQIGDPFILRSSDGKYYCYATSDGNYGFNVWISDDMIDWKKENFRAYSKTRESFGKIDFWAPEVYEWNNKYYMYYSAIWKENESFRIGVAVSDSPIGPFEDVSNEPIFDFGYGVIDAHVFVDVDDSAYLYYSRDCSENVVGINHESHSYGIKLSDDRLSVVGEPSLLVKPELKWEKESGRYRWNEGPFVINNNGEYILMYSANYYGDRTYSVGYAVSDSPLGKYDKPSDNRILYTEDDWTKISGTGHHMLIDIPETNLYYAVYHAHTTAAIAGGDRSLYIDVMGIREDGSLFVNGPTRSKQLKPAVYEEVLKFRSKYSITKNTNTIITLNDAEIAIYKTKKNTYEKLNNKDIIEITFDKSTEISGILLYDALENEELESVKLVFSNGTIINELSFTTNPGEPAIACFDPMKVEWVKILNNKNNGSLSEIIVIPTGLGNMNED